MFSKLLWFSLQYSSCFNGGLLTKNHLVTPLHGFFLRIPPFQPPIGVHWHYQPVASRNMTAGRRGALQRPWRPRRPAMKPQISAKPNARVWRTTQADKLEMKPEIVLSSLTIINNLFGLNQWSFFTSLITKQFIKRHWSSFSSLTSTNHHKPA